MNDTVEIAIAAAVQLGSLIWFLSAIRSDLKNLSGWVKTIDQRSEANAALTAELKGHLDALPCARCATR